MQVRDEQYEYKVISDRNLDKDFGIYECYKNGKLVPYPSRVKGTEMWRRARDADAALAAAAAAAPSKASRARAQRAVNKRRAQDQPDGQPTPKKSSRGLEDAAPLDEEDIIGHAPAKGLLASAAEVEAHPNGEEEEESAPASPEPSNQSLVRDPTREKSPPLPKTIGEPDEYGFRLYNQRASTRASGAASRFFAPRIFDFDDWEIGFRDTYNDSTKGHTRTKRGKYLDKPNSTGMHFDHWCNGYDFGTTEPEDFDQELVEKHNVHPLYGIFMPESKNDLEEGNPCVMPGKPVVYIANPSGRISHASRSFTSTVNHRRAEEAPLRTKVRASMRRFCKLAELEEDEISTAEFVRTEDQMRKKALRTAAKEMKLRPREKQAGDEDDEQDVKGSSEDDAESLMSAMSVLTYASAFVQASDSNAAAATPPKPARYDAIRDIFTSKPAPVAPAPVEPKSLELNFLAELCNVEARLPGGAPDDVVKKEERSSVLPNPSPYSSEPPAPFSSSSRSDRAFPQPPSSSYHSSYSRDSHHDYKPSSLGPPPPPPPHDHNYPYGPGSYSSSDLRDSHMSTGRPLDVGYNPRRVSGYGADAAPPPPPSYPRPYWSQPGPPPPPPGSSAPPPTAPPHYGSSSLPPPPPPGGRISFSQSSTGDLPPLRPPRSRNHSMEEPMNDPMRPGSGIYYPPGPSRSYHRGYSDHSAPPPPGSMHGGPANDRMLPQPAGGYMGSPPPPTHYNGQVLSPTFSHHHPPGPGGQSPPNTPQGLPGSRHRSTPSSASDAAAKYRKLQPAPVPAHRSWSNKPELKTIPYDHKETGSAAALPNSGPTQIRGWNVNQPRKRSKVEKERQEAAEREESR